MLSQEDRLYCIVFLIVLTIDINLCTVFELFVIEIVQTLPTGRSL